MRLGQLARKYNLTLQEVISYLKGIEPTHETLHHNSKLNEQTRILLAERFEYLEKPTERTSEEIEQKFVEPEIVDIGQTAEVPQSELDTPLPEAEVQDLQKKVEVVIETDKLLELLESEEVDLSKITRIKAPKMELSGLKIVGKIDLPEPKSKTAEKSEQREKEAEPDRNASHQRRQLSKEELEKRRLKAKKKERRIPGTSGKTKKRKRKEAKKISK